MSDIQSKIAARRALLAKQQNAQRDEELAAAQQREIAAREEEKVAFETLAAEISTSTTTVKHDGSALSIVSKPLISSDFVDLKNKQISAFLRRESRKRWTPFENWVVIGSMSGGLVLLSYSYYFCVVIFFGFLMGKLFTSEHRTDVIDDNPDVFSEYRSIE